MKTFVIEQTVRRIVETTRQYEVEAESKKEALEELESSDDPAQYITDEWDEDEITDKVLKKYHVTDEYDA